VVADQDDLQPVARRDREEALQVAGADHPGFVDHDRGPCGEPGGAGSFEVGEEPGQGAGWDAGARFESRRGPGGDRGADDADTGRFPRGAGRVESICFAGPRFPDDDLDPGPRRTDPADQGLLLSRQAGPRSDGGVDGVGAGDGDPGVGSPCGEFLDVGFGDQEVGGGPLAGRA